MGLQVVKRIGEGSLVSLETDTIADARDCKRRLREGDGTIGLEGDPDLKLYFDDASKTWVVIHHTQLSEPYVVARHTRPDTELLVKVAAADGRHHDVLGDVRRHNEALERAQAQAWEDRLDNELVPKARWAMRRDIGWDTRGQHVGHRTAPGLILPKGL